MSLYLAILSTLWLAPEINNLTDFNVTCHLWIYLESENQKEIIFAITYLVIGCLNLLCLFILEPITFHYVRGVKGQFYRDLSSHESNVMLDRDVIRRRFINGSRMTALVAGFTSFLRFGPRHSPY